MVHGRAKGEEVEVMRARGTIKSRSAVPIASDIPLAVIRLAVSAGSVLRLCKAHASKRSGS